MHTYKISMDSATVLQVGVAIAMLFLLVAALWPKLSCELSDNEQDRSSLRRRFYLWNRRRTHAPGYYGGRVRESYDRFLERWSKNGRDTDPPSPEDDKAA